MAKQKVRTCLRAYERRILDQPADKIVETVERAGADVSGPIPLPIKRSLYTVIRTTHKYKDSHEQSEVRIHECLVDVVDPTPKTAGALTKLDLPSGVSIEIEL